MVGRADQEDPTLSEPVLFMLALRKRHVSNGAWLALIMMGAEKRLDHSRLPAVTRRLLRWLYGRLGAVIVIGEGERDYLLQQGTVLPDRLHLVQFGVDTKCWTPAEGGGKQEYLLEVGNDDGQDYDTLLEAVGPHKLRLHIACLLNEAALPPPNVIRTKGDWSGQALLLPGAAG